MAIGENAIWRRQMDLRMTNLEGMSAWRRQCRIMACREIKMQLAMTRLEVMSNWER